METSPRRSQAFFKTAGLGPASWWRWLRENLFNTWYNGLLTVASLWILYSVVASVARWAFSAARWEVIPANLMPLMIGTYPRGQIWRIWTAMLTLAFLTGSSAGATGGRGVRLTAWAAPLALACLFFPLSGTTRLMMAGAAVFMLAGFWLFRGKRNLWPWLGAAWFLSFPWTLFLMWGIQGSEMLPRVETSAWGGLVLTLILALVGIAASLPIGILLALGRRSSLPVISWCCAALIELVRGTPLVTILFMAHLMVPIFLPELRIDKVVRAMIGLTIFTSAYMAENVRGGLQGVPKGQYEAAMALGMNGPLTMLLVILPQALRAVIPSIVGQFISLFKDTALVAIVGLHDLLGIANSVLANPNYLGRYAELYVFVAMVYWIFSYSMSHASRRLERRLGVGGR